MLADLLPNTAILKSPSNWLLVAFSMALLVLIAQIFNQQKEAK